MKVLEKTIKIILEPFRFLSNKNISESLAKFFAKHQYVIYILALCVTVIIFKLRNIF